MSILSNRLRELRLEKNLKQKDIANFLAISESAYGYYEQGKREPQIKTLRKLAEFYNVSAAYLIGLSHDKWQLGLIVDSTTKDENDHINLNKKTSDYIAQSKIEVTPSTIDTLVVPFRPKLNTNSSIQKNVDYYLTINNYYKLKEDEVYVTLAPDNSMSGDRILKGDKIVISTRDKNILKGDIAIVSINNNEITLRKVKKTKSDQIILYSSNSKYEPFLFNTENVEILGKVIQILINI